MNRTPPDAPALEELNRRFAAAHPAEIIRWAVESYDPEIALTSSFGAESACLLHLATQVKPDIRVRFIDTGFLFPETHAFREDLARLLNLNVQVIMTKMDVERFKREHAHLPVEHPDYCCGEYKIEATHRALQDLRCWVTGIRRDQASTRAATPFVDALSDGLVKVAPLAAWTGKQVYRYITENNLPFHPLWYKGYTSIGCYPCTQKPLDPNDPRSGRWAGQTKTECGIHDIGKPPESS